MWSMLVRSRSGLCMWINRSAQLPFHIGSMFCFPASIHSTWHDVGDSRFWIAYDMYSVSVANNFVHCQTSSGYGYHTIGELAQFIHCLTEDQTRVFIASCGAVGWLCVVKSLQISSNSWWRVSGRDAGNGSSQQDWEFIFEARIPTWRP